METRLSVDVKIGHTHGTDSIVVQHSTGALSRLGAQAQEASHTWQQSPQYPSVTSTPHSEQVCCWLDIHHSADHTPHKFTVDNPWNPCLDLTLASYGCLLGALKCFTPDSDGVSRYCLRIVYTNLIITYPRVNTW